MCLGRGRSAAERSRPYSRRLTSSTLSAPKRRQANAQWPERPQLAVAAGRGRAAGRVAHVDELAPRGRDVESAVDEQVEHQSVRDPESSMEFAFRELLLFSVVDA